MKTFILDIFPKLQQYSEKLDNLTLLTNQHWVSIDDITQSKTVYIFRTNNDLLISKNGSVEKAKWEYIGNKSVLIDKSEGSYLFKHGFFDENILALKLDSREEYALFVNENKYDGDNINSLKKVNEFLEQKYLKSVHQKVIRQSSEFENRPLNSSNPNQSKSESVPKIKSSAELEFEDLTVGYLVIGAIIAIIILITTIVNS